MTDFQPTSQQTLFLTLMCLHFMKREFETVFVHRFSNATMPFRNIFKNSFHYWILAGLIPAYFVYQPNSPAAASSPNTLLQYLGIALFAIGETGNLYCHYVLKGLRRKGTTERGLPKGFGFGLVTCPNYMFETIATLGMFTISGFSWSVLVYMVAAVGQMAQWAKKKEMRYRKEFGRKMRYSMIPGIW